LSSLFFAILQKELPNNEKVDELHSCVFKEKIKIEENEYFEIKKTK